MARQAKNSVKVSYQSGKGFKKCVGVYNGKPRIWWLGKDESKAQKLAASILDDWRKLQASGVAEWTPEAIAEIESRKAALSATAETPAAEKTSKPTISHAIAAYRKVVTADAKKGEARKAEVDAYLTRIEERIGETELDAFGFDALSSVINHFVSRPNSAKGKPYAVHTVRNILKDFRLFIDWLDMTDAFEWEAPRRWEKLFRQAKPKRTNEERMKAAKGISLFTTEELKTLYGNARERTRLWMLLALNCGFCTAELASLLIGECHLSATRPYIERIRAKTDDCQSVFSVRWYLWPETVKALREYIRSIPQKKANWKSGYEGEGNAETDLVFRTEDGFALRYYVGTTHFDSVRQSWNRLLKRTPNCQRLTFKFLRKTGSQLVRSIGGREMSEAYLSHTDKTTGRFYNNADFEKLGEALEAVRQQLTPIFAEVESQAA